MSTPSSEITKAVNSFSQQVLKDVLKAVGKPTTGKKPTLISNYEAAVMDVGISNFVAKLKAPHVKSACKSLSIENGADNLTEEVRRKGLSKLLGAADEALLKQFSNILGLEEIDSKKEMEQQIADEVMLTGMESFLNNLKKELLQSHCKELKLDTNGSESELVERIMVNVFELEPLEKEGKDKEKKDSKEKKDGKKKKDTKKKETEGDEPEDKKKKKGESKKRKADKEEEPPVKKPKGPAVRPPISTIKAGAKADELHNKFNATDLREWCKENGLLVSGKKPVLIKRIVKFLETGTKDGPKKPKSKKGKGAASKSKDASADAKEGPDPKDNKEKEATPKKKADKKGGKKGKGSDKGSGGEKNTASESSEGAEESAAAPSDSKTTKSDKSKDKDAKTKDKDADKQKDDETRKQSGYWSDDEECDGSDFEPQDDDCDAEGWSDDEMSADEGDDDRDATAEGEADLWAQLPDEDLAAMCANSKIPTSSLSRDAILTALSQYCYHDNMVQ